MVITFDLPFPPSSNTYWRSIPNPHKRGEVLVILSKEARLYKQEIKSIFRREKMKAAAGSVAVSYTLWFPARRGDLGNREKVLSDCLNGITWVDDKQIGEIHLYRRFGGRAAARVEVSIWPIVEDQWY